MKRGYAYKSAIDKQTKKALGMTFKEAIEKNVCFRCGELIKSKDFKNAISIKEYNISQMCQKCQDEVFGEE